MYFNIALAIQRNGKKVNDLAKEASKNLSCFDYSKEVPQYKRYLEKNEIDNIAKKYNLSVNDYESIVMHVIDYHCQGEGGYDDKGIYELSTSNPEGQFDHWHVFYYATSDDFDEKILGKEWPLVSAFVTPELEWIEGYWGNIENAVATGEEEKYYEWKEKISILLEKYKDCAIFIVRCHF